MQEITINEMIEFFEAHLKWCDDEICSKYTKATIKILQQVKQREGKCRWTPYLEYDANAKIPSCIKCYEYNTDGFKFCPFCGKEIEWAEE